MRAVHTAPAKKDGRTLDARAHNKFPLCSAQREYSYLYLRLRAASDFFLRFTLGFS